MKAYFDPTTESILKSSENYYQVTQWFGIHNSKSSLSAPKNQSHEMMLYTDLMVKVKVVP